MRKTQAHARWTIVLAAGEGRRLAPLTRALYGDPRPKQFAVLRGQRSLLQETVERMSGFSDGAHTVVVVPSEHEDLAREQLAAWPELTVVAQPHNRGTGPGVLLPLAHVLARDPAADVVVTPSDHHVERADRMFDAIHEAVSTLDHVPVSLVGVRATRAETEYGWIVEGERRRGRIRELASFVEKPSLEHAQALLRAGGLWNTFLMVARASELWALASMHLPEQAREILRAHRDPDALERAYARMRDANFSEQVLARSRDLGVVAAEGTGWTDLGSPHRVLESVAPGRDRERLEALAMAL